MARRTRVRDATMLETRQALIAAGMAAFGEGGLDAPSLDSICERAGYTRGAFYVHFKDRDDFIVAVMDQLTEGFIGSILGGPVGGEGSPADLAALVARFAQAVSIGAYPLPGAVRLHHILDACSRSDVVRARRARLLRDSMDLVGEYARDSQRRGKLRADVDPGQLGALSIAIVLGIEVLTELCVPFGATGAAGTVMDLLRPASAASPGPQGEKPKPRRATAPRAKRS